MPGSDDEKVAQRELSAVAIERLFAPHMPRCDSVYVGPDGRRFECQLSSGHAGLHECEAKWRDDDVGI